MMMRKSFAAELGRDALVHIGPYSVFSRKNGFGLQPISCRGTLELQQQGKHLKAYFAPG
jgi:hypothetical protein